jgi:Nineteen complex-related protein 2
LNKKTASSRLSFGLGEIISGDAAEALEDDETFTPKKLALSRWVIESNALRKSLPAYQLPMRSGEDEEDRPIYSKDYLNELKNSTPSTPKELRALSVTADDAEGLDESELDGAMIVETEVRSESASAMSAILTEVEIRERKERRARLAHEQDFISLDDNDSDNRQQISLLPRKKKAETRLVREDEDLGEGFDEFVDDGRISLGKKAEREAKRKQRAAIAELINEAEGSSSDDSHDSEAERRAAFESAQTRAGMDGLSRPGPASTMHQIPPKITPLPNLSECLQRLQTTLSDMQQELARRNTKMEQLQQEKREILAREEEVQRLLKEAGDRYSAMRADTGLPPVDAKTLMEGRNGFMGPIDVNRGLESFGNTPTVRPQMDDVG